MPGGPLPAPRNGHASHNGSFVKGWNGKHRSNCSPALRSRPARPPHDHHSAIRCRHPLDFLAAKRSTCPPRRQPYRIPPLAKRYVFSGNSRRMAVTARHPGDAPARTIRNPRIRDSRHPVPATVVCAPSILSCHTCVHRRARALSSATHVDAHLTAWERSSHGPPPPGAGEQGTEECRELHKPRTSENRSGRYRRSSLRSCVPKSPA